MPYDIEIIGPDVREELYSKYAARFLYTRKAEIYGCCIKLLTDQEHTKNMWDDNFYNMSESVRSHGSIIVLDDPKQRTGVRYDPLTKTAFLFNFDYYGWIKSVALALTGDILEDEHHIYSVHGAAIDLAGRGVSLIAPSKTGKTTHSWGLLCIPGARLVTDDWYYVRLCAQRPMAFGSEKNFYIEGDIAGIWPEYQGLVEGAHFDNKGRAIVNLRWTVGQGGVVPMTTIYHLILLIREPDEKRTLIEPSKGEALDHLLEHDFCNPHQLVRDDRKLKIRKGFFERFLAQCDVHIVNTIGSPTESQTIIRDLLID